MRWVSDNLYYIYFGTIQQRYCTAIHEYVCASLPLAPAVYSTCWPIAPSWRFHFLLIVQPSPSPTLYGVGTTTSLSYDHGPGLGAKAWGGVVLGQPPHTSTEQQNVIVLCRACDVGYVTWW